jgi:hypothetical protein
MAQAKAAPVPGNWTGTPPGGIARTLTQMTPVTAGFSRLQHSATMLSDKRSELLRRADPTLSRHPLSLPGRGVVGRPVGVRVFQRGRWDLVVQIWALTHLGIVFSIVVLMLANLRPFDGLASLGSLYPPDGAARARPWAMTSGRQLVRRWSLSVRSCEVWRARNGKR